MDLIAIFGWVVGVIFLAVMVGFICWMILGLIKVGRESSRKKAETKQQASQLHVGTRYHLTDAPHPADIEIEEIYEPTRWLLVKLVVMFPSGCEVRGIHPLADRQGYVIVYSHDGVWETEAWRSDWSTPMLFRNFWAISIKDILVVPSSS